MKALDLSRECEQLTESVERGFTDFGAMYMAVGDLHSLIRSRPGVAAPRTVAALKTALNDPAHASQKQSLFLYKEAAGALAALVAGEEFHGELFQAAGAALRSVMLEGSGNARRASAEAMGALPVAVSCPFAPQPGEPTDGPLLKIQDVRELAGAVGERSCRRIGRSLVFPAPGGKSLVVKTDGGNRDSVAGMCMEILWMEELGRDRLSFPARFDLPTPIRMEGSAVFRLGGSKLLPKTSSDETFAVAFLAPSGYFSYVNGFGSEHRPGKAEFEEAVLRNARLMGFMTAQGVVHTAPIPLFHNRVQTARRNDGGLYEWQRGGRLDRWLHSCRYPNFGMTGLRDFEHFEAFNGSGEALYRHIGTQVLSLLLVAGSWFRAAEPERAGLDEAGNPVDARHLFDAELLARLIEGIFLNYYHGFTGTPHTEEMPFRADVLAARMIDEMGVDRHMEEILRAVDQQTMSDAEFRDFLVLRGYSSEAAMGVPKGAEDLVIHTGPHLGGFNQRISLPEIIEYLAVTAAFCIEGRHRAERLRRAA